MQMFTQNEGCYKTALKNRWKAWLYGGLFCVSTIAWPNSAASVVVQAAEPVLPASVQTADAVLPATVQANVVSTPVDQATVTTTPLVASTNGPVVRIKDITHVQGVRDNQLVGLGLVVGLDGTGDGNSSQANIQMVTNMLQQFGVAVDTRFLRLRNVAAVMVTATLPAFARSGDVIDVTVSSMGDARSLQGGVLLQTPLQAGDGEVYAVAQGALAVGGQSSTPGRITRTPALTALIPGGAIVEKEVPSTFVQGDELLLVLNTPDFSTASRVAQAINKAIAPGIAQAIDKSGIKVSLPKDVSTGSVDFLAVIEELPVEPDAPARVVINERTGTVIIGAGVRVAPVAVTHGNLSVKIGSPTESVISSYGSRDAQPANQTTLLGGASVEDIVKGLNAIGATPKDIVALLLAIKAAGALFGELVVI